MTPYYDEDGITLYLADARDVLPVTPNIDAVITDPPYGVGMTAYEDDFSVVAEVLTACSGKLAAVFMSPRRVVELAASLDGDWSVERLLWMHKTADMAAPWRHWCMNSEAIMVMSRKQARWPKPVNYRSDVYSVGPWERTGHPNGKPLSVVSDLVRRLVTTTVLDPFAGSGTTLVAAKREGKCAIGIEVEERFCEMAARRLSQGVLDFGGAA